MAKVTEVVLQNFTSTNDVSKLRAQVDYKIQFAPQEAGQKYRIEVSLVASDLPPDDEPPPPIGSDPKTLYNFVFGNPLQQAVYKMVQVNPNQLLISDSVTADVPKTVLNEDPGNLPGPGPLPHPRLDEIRARVRVVAQTLSNVQKVLI